MLASRARHVARDLVTRAIAAPMAALASAPALDSVAATARDHARGGAFGADELRAASWAPRVSARDGSERAGSVPPSARARFADTRATPSAPRWPRRRAPFQPWRVDPAPPRSLTVRELQACLRASASARARDFPEYGGDFSGEDEDAWQDALGAAIRAIALEDGTGTAPSSVRTPAAAETEASADAAEAFFLRAAAAPPPRGAVPAFFPAFANQENEGFAAASVKLKRVKKMNKHKHRKRRKRDRNKTK